jgi:hypothetical protein
MCVCVCVCTYIFVCISVFIYIYIYNTYTCTYTVILEKYTTTYTYRYLYACVCVCIYGYLYMCICVHIYEYEYMCVYTYTYMGGLSGWRDYLTLHSPVIIFPLPSPVFLSRFTGSEKSPWGKERIEFVQEFSSVVSYLPQKTFPANLSVVISVTGSDPPSR